MNTPEAAIEASQIESSAQSAPKSLYLYWWLLLAILFEYARPGSFVPGIDAIKLNSLIPLGLLVVSTFAKNMRPPKEIFADPLTKWMLMYLGLITISVVHADVTTYAFDKFITVLGYLFLFWLIARIATTPARVRGVFATLMVAHVILLVMNPNVVLDPNTRSYIDGATFLGDGNDFALSLCILAPLGIDLAFSTRSKWMRIIYCALTALLLLSAIGTASRGASLALIAVAGYLWWRCPRKLLTLSIISVITLGVLAYASDMYIERMATLSNYEEEGSAQGRIMAWKASIRMAIDNPILGVGAGQFPTSFGAKYMPKNLEGPIPWLTAHSMYFLVLGELGLTGIITLLYLVFGNIRTNTRMQKAITADATLFKDSKTLADLNRLLLLLSAGMIGLAVAGAFLSVAYYPHLFVLTGLFVAARRTTVSMAGPEFVAKRRTMSHAGTQYQLGKASVPSAQQPRTNLPVTKLASNRFYR
jgi:probable O-glycosylation ligase (exosortase A-associated)